MNKLISILCLIPLGLCCACSNDEEVATEDQYYVHYTAGASSEWNQSIMTYFFYNDANGREAMYHNRGFDLTIGPVRQGFSAAVRVKDDANSFASIEVSKNGEPFVQKAYSAKGSARYVIDF